MSVRTGCKITAHMLQFSLFPHPCILYDLLKCSIRITKTCFIGEMSKVNVYKMPPKLHMIIIIMYQNIIIIYFQVYTNNFPWGSVSLSLCVWGNVGG